MFKGSTRGLVVAAAFTLLATITPASLRADTPATMPAPTIAPPSIPNKTFSIADYGAVGDGTTLNTDAITKALTACSQAGGGTVLVPAGKFLTGPFTLVSNLDLKIDQGATLIFSDDNTLYPVAPDPTNPSSEGNGQFYKDFISGDHLHDLAITGAGTIDGQGAKWWKAFAPFKNDMHNPAAPPHRPLLINIKYCQRIDIEGVTLTNSPMMHLATLACQDVLISGITIIAPPKSPNTDGLDPSGSNYLIKNCNISTGDDNIALKPVKGAIDGHPACENFLITDCTFGRGHGMSVGGQTSGGLNNVTVQNCTFQGTDAGIRMKAPRGSGGLVQNLTYNNLTMDGVKHAISISSVYPIPKVIDFGTTRPADDKTPIWKDIQISNVTATDSSYAGEIIGLPEMPITGITFTNVKIAAKHSLRVQNANQIKFVNSEIDVEDPPAVAIIDATVEGIDPLAGK
ncbi:MAG: glycoside hydrolase family 28 protein [Tepidisphaeraceae bacterium]|jgi:polygalacturonase